MVQQCITTGTLNALEAESISNIGKQSWRSYFCQCLRDCHAFQEGNTPCLCQLRHKKDLRVTIEHPGRPPGNHPQGPGLVRQKPIHRWAPYRLQLAWGLPAAPWCTLAGPDAQTHDQPVTHTWQVTQQDKVRNGLPEALAQELQMYCFVYAMLRELGCIMVKSSSRNAYECLALRFAEEICGCLTHICM